MDEKVTGLILAITGLVLLVLSAVVPAGVPVGPDLAYADAPFNVTAKAASAVLTPKAGEQQALTLYRELDTAGNALEAWVLPSGAGPATLTVTRTDGSITERPVWVIAKGWAWAAGAAVILLLLGIPMAWFSPTGRTTAAGEPVGAWYYLLGESGPSGGLSLARVQLLVWFGAALVIYTMLSLPLHVLAPMDETLAVLLGLGGATTLFSSAATPRGRNGNDQVRSTLEVAKSAAALQATGGSALSPETMRSIDVMLQRQVAQATAGTQVEAGDPKQMVSLDLTDLVTDHTGESCFTRFQYLMICMIGAVIFFLAFLQTWEIPEIPPQLLALLAASQATYVGAKAVSTMRT